MVWYGMVWYGMVWYYLVCCITIWYARRCLTLTPALRYDMVVYVIVWGGMVLYGMVLYGAAWYGVMLYDDMLCQV